jgi:hypothetical protein
MVYVGRFGADKTGKLGYDSRRLFRIPRMNPNPLSESDLDRLEQLLEADVFEGDAMRLDEIQAMLCAVVSGPLPIGGYIGITDAYEQ